MINNKNHFSLFSFSKYMAFPFFVLSGLATAQTDNPISINEGIIYIKAMKLNQFVVWAEDEARIACSGSSWTLSSRGSGWDPDTNLETTIYKCSSSDSNFIYVYTYEMVPYNFPKCSAHVGAPCIPD